MTATAMVSTVATTLRVTRAKARCPSVETTITAELPLDIPLTDLRPILQPLVDPDIPVEKYHVVPGYLTLNVTKEASTFEGELQINVDQRLVQYYKEFRRHHGRNVGRKSSSVSSLATDDRQARDKHKNASVSYRTNTITVGPATFSFNRTLRITDDATDHGLPSGLGSFPLAKVQQYANVLPQHVARRGGYIMPLYQCEALWINIGGRRCAIKVSIGDRNAITGSKRNEEMLNDSQDYILVVRPGAARLLDGISTTPGVVRQFVAVKTGPGYIAEEQLSDTATGRIQIDVFPALTEVVQFNLKGSYELPLDKSPRELDILPQRLITMKSTEFPIVTLRDMLHYASHPVLENHIFLKRLTGSTIDIPFETHDTVENLKARIQDYEGISPDSQVLVLYHNAMKRKTPRAVLLQDGKTLADYDVVSEDIVHLMFKFRGKVDHELLEDARKVNGGKITQKIYRDINSPIIYDEEDPHRVFIHTVSPVAWEMITGVLCPMTPITPALYKDYSYPWLALYDEQHLPTLDPASSPNCSTHLESPARCVARPCSHLLCSECLEKSALREMECVICDAEIQRLVGFNNPIQSFTRGSGSEGAWWEGEAPIEGVADEGPDVVTLFLDEDSVCKLHGAPSTDKLSIPQ
ncbi:hypothetical protein R3P38DRAFT_2971295 [Favolaschia claudopus]|uniref:Ubiquitin-like domain-containing protein n=1 Tax=Favolaschia claudopus TaxID=2862362 RepID=A0AAW0B4S9_9AGAR